VTPFCRLSIDHDLELFWLSRRQATPNSKLLHYIWHPYIQMFVFVPILVALFKRKHPTTIGKGLMETVLELGEHSIGAGWLFGDSVGTGVNSVGTGG
jgi:hypothetical protein